MHQTGTRGTQVHVDGTTIISRPEQAYCGWPTLLRKQDGTLLVVCSGGRQHHVCPFGQVHLIKSVDGGKTWHRHRVLVDGPLDDRDAGALETARGTLLVNWFTSLTWEYQIDTADPQRPSVFTRLDDAERQEWLERKAALTDAVRHAELGAWAIRSTDRGQTWSARIDTIANSPHGPLLLSNGDLLYPGIRRLQGQVGRVGSPFGDGVGASISRDDGQTWQWLSTIPGGTYDPQQFHELHGVQAADGRVIVHIRNHGDRDKHQVLQTESSDLGVTWTEPRPTGLWGFPAHLIKASDGTLVTSFGHRREPVGNQVSFSRDHGRTWSAPVPLNIDSATHDMGYPSTAELEPGRFLTVWYDQGHLRQARWRIG